MTNEYNDGRAHIVLPVEPLPAIFRSLVEYAIERRCDVYAHFLDARGDDLRPYSITISQRGMRGNVHLWTNGKAVRVSRTFKMYTDSVSLNLVDDMETIISYIDEYARVKD